MKIPSAAAQLNIQAGSVLRQPFRHPSRQLPHSQTVGPDMGRKLHLFIPVFTAFSRDAPVRPRPDLQLLKISPDIRIRQRSRIIKLHIFRPHSRKRTLQAPLSFIRQHRPYPARKQYRRMGSPVPGHRDQRIRPPRQRCQTFQNPLHAARRHQRQIPWQEEHTLCLLHRRETKPDGCQHIRLLIFLIPHKMHTQRRKNLFHLISSVTRNHRNIPDPCIFQTLHCHLNHGKSVQLHKRLEIPHTAGQSGRCNQSSVPHESIPFSWRSSMHFRNTLSTTSGQRRILLDGSSSRMSLQSHPL